MSGERSGIDWFGVRIQCISMRHGAVGACSDSGRVIKLEFHDPDTDTDTDILVRLSLIHI